MKKNDSIRQISRQLQAGEQPFYHQQKSDEVLNQTVHGVARLTSVDLAIREIQRGKSLTVAANKLFLGDRTIEGRVINTNALVAFENSIKKELERRGIEYEE